MFLALKKFHNLNINKNDKSFTIRNTEIELSVASVEQMELHTDIQNCEAVNGALSPCIFCCLLSDDEFVDKFPNAFASEFVTIFFPNSYL